MIFSGEKARTSSSASSILNFPALAAAFVLALALGAFAAPPDGGFVFRDGASTGVRGERARIAFPDLSASFGAGYQGFAPAPAQAAGPKTRPRQPEFTLSIGGLTTLDSEYAGFLLTLTGQIDIPLAERISLSPEVQLLASLYGGARLLPGVLLNYTFKNGLFIGGGSAAYLGAHPSGLYFLPKLNVGYKGRRVTVSAFILSSFDRFLQAALIGANVGYRF